MTKRFDALSLLVNTHAPGYDVRVLTCDDRAIEVVARRMATMGVAEEKSFLNLAMNSTIPFKLLTKVLGTKFIKRGQMLFNLATLRSTLSEVSSEAGESEVYTLIMGIIFNRLGILHDEQEIYIPKRELDLIPTEDDIQEELRYFSLQKTMDTWFIPLDGVGDTMYPAPTATKISECLKKFHRSFRLTGDYIDSWRRSKEIVKMYLWDIPMEAVLLQNPDLVELANVANIILPMLSDTRQPPYGSSGTPKKEKKKNGNGDNGSGVVKSDFSYQAYHDERRLRLALEFVNSVSGDIKKISLAEYASWFHILPITSHYEKELRIIGILPAYEPPSFSTQFLNVTPATEFFKDVYLAIDVATTGGNSSASMLEEAIQSGINALRPEPFMDLVERNLNIFADHMPGDEPFITFKTFGMKTNDRPLRFAGNPIGEQMAYLCLANVETFHIDKNEIVFKRAYNPEVIIPPTLPLHKVELIDYEIWCRDLQFILLGKGKQTGKAYPQGIANPASVISGTTYIQLSGDMKPRMVADTEISVSYQKRNLDGSFSDLDGSVNLQKLLELEHQGDVFYFHNTALKSYINEVAQFLDWSLEMSEKDDVIRTSTTMFGLSVLIRMARTILAKKGAYHILAAAQDSPYKPRNIDDMLARASLKVCFGAALIGDMTGTSKMWQSLMSASKEIRYTMMMSLLQNEEMV
jgi:hypothetical protein